MKDINKENQDMEDIELKIDEEKTENFFKKEKTDEQTENIEAEEEKSALNALKEENETLKNQYLRLAADFDNYRKRYAQERESLLKYGSEEILKKLLPLLDTFEKARESFLDVEDPEKIREGFDALHKQFGEILEKAGLQKIETVAQQFDPNYHEAVMQTPSEEHPDHSIIAELQSGYKLNDKVIRPALVNVAINS